MTPLHMSSACTLLVIDLQERLLGAMHPEDGERAVRQARTLVALAEEVGAEIVYTEQYPDGLGPTVEGLREELLGAGATHVEKIHFDVCTAPDFEPIRKGMRRRVIACGIEAHVCVLSTARSLLGMRHDVLVPFDAVASRARDYRDNGIALLRGAGATITNTETIVFETLGSSAHPRFKEFSARIR